MSDFETLSRVEVLQALRVAIDKALNDNDPAGAVDVIVDLHDRLLLDHHWVDKVEITRLVGADFTNQ